MNETFGGIRDWFTKLPPAQQYALIGGGVGGLGGAAAGVIGNPKRRGSSGVIGGLLGGLGGAGLGYGLGELNKAEAEAPPPPPLQGQADAHTSVGGPAGLYATAARSLAPQTEDGPRVSVSPDAINKRLETLGPDAPTPPSPLPGDASTGRHAGQIAGAAGGYVAGDQGARLFGGSLAKATNKATAAGAAEAGRLHGLAGEAAGVYPPSPKAPPDPRGLLAKTFNPAKAPPQVPTYVPPNIPAPTPPGPWTHPPYPKPGAFGPDYTDALQARTNSMDAQSQASKAYTESLGKHKELLAEHAKQHETTWGAKTKGIEDATKTFVKDKPHVMPPRMFGPARMFSGLLSGAAGLQGARLMSDAASAAPPPGKAEPPTVARSGRSDR